MFLLFNDNKIKMAMKAEKDIDDNPARWTGKGKEKGQENVRREPSLVWRWGDPCVISRLHEL